LEVAVMTTSGKELLGFVREIQRFAAQVADLLGHVDKLMDGDGWELATSQNIAYASPSQSLDKPRQWFPNEVFRFYRADERPHVMPFVSVLLDDDRRGDYKLEEPLLTAGWFEFEGAAPPTVGSDCWWWSRFHGYMPDPRRDDGGMNVVIPKQAWPDEYRPAWYPFDRAVTLAVPLVQVTDTRALEQKIITPLLNAVREARLAGTP
jgi:hypothetical protein